jgi:hypothetical protein
MNNESLEEEEDAESRIEAGPAAVGSKDRKETRTKTRKKTGRRVATASRLSCAIIPQCMPTFRLSIIV